MKKAIKVFFSGIARENPILGLMLGLCPALAVTTSLVNAIGMGISVIFVLLCSNFIISCVSKLIPSQLRIPCYIVIIASFVTLVELFINRWGI